MSADRWDAYRPTMVPSGTGEKREYETVVLAAVYERDVAAAEVRGWNAAIKAALEYGLGDQEQSAIAALRKDTGREVGG